MSSSPTGALFQSTLPMQGETCCDFQTVQPLIVSIHSPYAGRDALACQPVRGPRSFNPLSLCRERRESPCRPVRQTRFNPLSLCRERPDSKDHIDPQLSFNPLSLCRERHARSLGGDL